MWRNDFLLSRATRGEFGDGSQFLNLCGECEEIKTDKSGPVIMRPRASVMKFRVCSVGAYPTKRGLEARWVL